MSRTLIVLHIALALTLAGCASAPALRCDAGEQLLVSEMLYFGTEKPGGVVTAEEWSWFLRDVVTPRFPEGLTAWPASGQWRSAGGEVTREASHVLNLIHPETEAAESAVRETVTEYKNRFRQEAVLRVKGNACVSF
ncbi:MAG: DUF3574 domain-containing protein [Desulfobulbaceae bacterium]